MCEIWRKAPDSSGKLAGGKLAVGRSVIGALAVALIMKFFILDFMVTEGDSMVPAIKPGSILLVCKLYYGLRVPGSGAYLLRWRNPRAGEVVVFYTPPGDIAVKRCGEIVPQIGFFARGDNGPLSYDSRDYGLVPNENIIGKVLGIK